jgi:glutaredoxin
MQNEQVDQCLTCSGCGGNFNYSVAEQVFFQKMNFESPRRCPKCRKDRKSLKQASQEVEIVNRDKSQTSHNKKTAINYNHRFNTISSNSNKLTPEEIISELQDQIASLKEENSRLKRDRVGY